MHRHVTPHSLADWLIHLESLSPREIVLGLDRVREVRKRLKIAPPARVISVAGTNGKGSTVAILETILLHNGMRVGCYTSPHLCRFNERIRVAGREVSDDELIAAFVRVELARAEVPLTYFEFGTLAALVLFEQLAAETVVLEVGMGGRLDAVNAVEPDGSIITNISLDHCDWLGTNVEDISREKAGIMRADKPVIFVSPEVPAAITGTAAELGADLRCLGRDFGFRLDAGRGVWSFHGRNVQLEDLPIPAEAATIQVQNSTGALALLEALNLLQDLDRDATGDALATLRVPGRQQRVEAGRSWLLDVAHNAESARVLGESLADISSGSGVVAIIGAMANKDLGSLVRPLCQYVDRWIAVTATGARAARADSVAAGIAQICGRPCLECDDIGEAMKIARRRASADELILVTGSFYVVGPALDELYSRREGGA